MLSFLNTGRFTSHMYNMPLYACTLHEPALFKFSIDNKVANINKNSSNIAKKVSDGDAGIPIQDELNPNGMLAFPATLKKGQYLTIVPRFTGGTRTRLVHNGKEADYMIR